MSRLAIIILINLFAISLTLAQETTYLKVEAKKGDGVYSLLRQYELLDEYCNVLQFYKLNKLKKDASLHVGKRYNIPILIYKYNSESIRSTIGNDDWDQAVSIQKYNERMLAAKKRPSSYRDSKQLWVRFSTVYCNKNKKSKQTAPIAAQNKEKNPQKTIAAATKEMASNKPVTTKTSSETKSNTTHKPAKTNNSAPKKVMKTDELFGPQFSSYQEADQSLKDKVFFIVSGHGGPDPGAMCTTCPSELCEDEYAYDVALRLARNLKQHGAHVEMIIQDKNDGIRTEKFLKCDRDEKALGKSKIPLNHKKRLAQRSNAINMLSGQYKKKGIKDQVSVFIHVDSTNKGKRQDVFFYHHKNSSKGKKLAKNIQDTFQAKYEKYQKGRGYKGTVSHRNLYVIRNTNPPAVFIELANIRNPKDQQRIILDTNRQALANWIFLGLIKK